MKSTEFALKTNAKSTKKKAERAVVLDVGVESRQRTTPINTFCLGGGGGGAGGGEEGGVGVGGKGFWVRRKIGWG